METLVSWARDRTRVERGRNRRDWDPRYPGESIVGMALNKLERWERSANVRAVGELEGHEHVDGEASVTALITSRRREKSVTMDRQHHKETYNFPRNPSRFPLSSFIRRTVHTRSLGCNGYQLIYGLHPRLRPNPPYASQQSHLQ